MDFARPPDGLRSPPACCAKLAPAARNLRFAFVSVNVTRAMSRALAILWILALPLHALADDLPCPPGAALRGEGPATSRREWCEDEQHRQHGPSVTWDEQHRRRVEAHFAHGAMEGPYKSWHEN